MLTVAHCIAILSEEEEIMTHDTNQPPSDAVAPSKPPKQKRKLYPRPTDFRNPDMLFPSWEAADSYLSRLGYKHVGQSNYWAGKARAFINPVSNDGGLSGERHGFHINYWPLEDGTKRKKLDEIRQSGRAWQ